MQSYAEHFDLLSHTVFNASVTRVYRDDTDSHWILDIDKPEGKRDTVHFDKVAFCHGYQTRQKLPQYPGLDTYEGSFTHFQQYRECAPPPSPTVLDPWLILNSQSARV